MVSPLEAREAPPNIMVSPLGEPREAGRGVTEVASAAPTVASGRFPWRSPPPAFARRLASAATSGGGRAAAGRPHSEDSPRRNADHVREYGSRPSPGPSLLRSNASEPGLPGLTRCSTGIYSRVVAEGPATATLFRDVLLNITLVISMDPDGVGGRRDL